MNDFKQIFDKFYKTISLNDIEKVKLMRRNDTKYIFNIAQLYGILKQASQTYKVLEVNNIIMQDYKTVYFDTPNFEMYTLHHNRKLNRYKIRKREYLNSKTSYLELKFKNNKGTTEKKRTKVGNITTKFNLIEKSFIETSTPYKISHLQPVLTNQFTRITLINLQKAERITLDINLSYQHNERRIELPNVCIAEVKQEGFSETEFKKILKNNKIYSNGYSKYCTGVVLLYKNLKYNNFKRKLTTISKLNNNDLYIS